jgi:hypothetical protein
MGLGFIGRQWHCVAYLPHSENLWNGAGSETVDVVFRGDA